LLSGALIGEALRIEYWFERWGEWLQSATAKLPWLVPVTEMTDEEVVPSSALPEDETEAVTQAKGHTIVDGFVTATLIFCVGAMTVVGAIQDGLGNPDTLYLKALLDGITAVALSSALGWGVTLSVIPVVIIKESCIAFCAVWREVTDGGCLLQSTQLAARLLWRLGLI